MNNIKELIEERRRVENMLEANKMAKSNVMNNETITIINNIIKDNEQRLKEINNKIEIKEEFEEIKDLIIQNSNYIMDLIKITKKRG